MADFVIGPMAHWANMIRKQLSTLEFVKVNKQWSARWPNCVDSNITRTMKVATIIGKHFDSRPQDAKSPGITKPQVPSNGMGS